MMNSKFHLDSVFTKKRPHVGVLLFFVALSFWSCSKSEPQTFRGLTMGTSWSAVIADSVSDPEAVHAAIQEELNTIDQLMSNWKDDSDVCLFNEQPANQGLTVSQQTITVMQKSMEIFHMTEGRFDPTLGPLIELWGFSRKEHNAFPEEAQIQEALSRQGMKHIEISGRQLIKKVPGVSINLSAIAKGYGVDAAFNRLERMGFKHFLLEVGGEVRVKGNKSAGQPWRIGIETPRYEAVVSREIFTIAYLEDISMATSGDYRNFFEYDGRKYSHIIDPSTGYPVTSSIASATVLAPDCTTADAFATAFMILSPEKSIEICDQDPTMMCLIIEKESGEVYYSKGMRTFLHDVE